MSKFLLSITLALALSALGASSALAEAPEGAQKSPLFGPFFGVLVDCESGAAPTPETFGFAVLNTPGDETTVSGEVALKHAAPDASYGVTVVGGDCSKSPVGVITTNKMGNGNLHFTTARDPATNLFFVAVEGPESFFSNARELD